MTVRTRSGMAGDPAWQEQGLAGAMATGRQKLLLCYGHPSERAIHFSRRLNAAPTEGPRSRGRFFQHRESLKTMATLRKLPTMVAVAAFTAALSGCGGNDGKLVRDLEADVAAAVARAVAAEAAQLVAETAQTEAETARMTAETMATAAATRADEAEQAQMAAEMRRDEAVDAEMAAQEAQMAAQEAQTAAEMRRDEAVAAEAAAVTARMIAQEAQMAAVTARNEADAAARASAADAAEKAREAAVAQARADAAMEARMTAEQARDDAVAAQMTAEQERDDAVAAQMTAEQERDDAVAAQMTAEQERDDAVEAQRTAEQERDDAVEAQRTAQQERDDAVKKYEDLRDERDTQAADTARKKRLARGNALYGVISRQPFVEANADRNSNGSIDAIEKIATVLQDVPGGIRDIRGLPITDAEIVVERTMAAPDMVTATLGSNMSLKPTGTAQAGMATADGSWSDVAIEWELVPDDQTLTEYADNVIMVYSDIEAPEEGRVLMTSQERADGYKVIMPPSGTHNVLPKTLMLDNPPGPTTNLKLGNEKSVRGEYLGAPGRLECRGTGPGGECNLALNADGKLTLTGAKGKPQLWFHPDDANAMYTVEDSHYLRFGWWAEADASVISALTSATVSMAEVFVGEIGGETNPVKRANEIEGTASYVGPAAGQYVTFDKVAGVRTDADVGYFTATATLTANFDSDAPTPTTANKGYGIISGSVRGFEGADGEAKPWIVTLNETGFTKSGAIGYKDPAAAKDDMPDSARNDRLVPSDERMNPSVDVSFGGSRAVNKGYWLGQFYYQNESNTVDASGTPVETYAPGAVGGIFDAQTSEGNLLGAFGALLQE